jgi:hypothetical protein
MYRLPGSRALLREMSQWGLRFPKQVRGGRGSETLAKQKNICADCDAYTDGVGLRVSRLMRVCVRKVRLRTKVTEF